MAPRLDPARSRILSWCGTPRTLRAVLSLGLIPLFVILAWEGGLFFIPSAMALIVAHGWEPAPHQSGVHPHKITGSA